MDIHKNTPLRILEIVYKNPLSIPGGLEFFSLNIGQEFADRNYLIDYIFIRDFKLKEILKPVDLGGRFAENTKFIELKISRFYDYLGMSKLIYSLKLGKYINRNIEKYDVIHFNGDNGGNAGIRSTSLKIMTWHGSSNSALVDCPIT
ncbi:hypothetical protein [Ferroplasma sp.]|uniref:hypothetical protein n=1 Tax=Ferroplasma sp. TaxID=2591003 RepID=UPI002601905F|nr:hypothetical protein [Ferroplasma sp.]